MTPDIGCCRGEAPEPNGIQWQPISDIIKNVALHKHVVGFDLMEFCPREGPIACAFLLAKLAYKLIGYAVPKEQADIQSPF